MNLLICLINQDFIKGDVANFYEKNSNIVTDYAGKWDGGIVPYRINDIFS